MSRESYTFEPGSDGMPGMICVAGASRYTASRHDAAGDFWMQEVDRSFYDRELASFIPDKVFDEHIHLWRLEHFSWRVEGSSGDVGNAEYRRLIQEIHGEGRTKGFLALPPIVAHDKALRADANTFLSQEVQDDENSRGLFLVHPDDDPEWVRQEVRRLKLSGLKCYHTMAPSTPTWEADIPEYLPERLIKVADEEGWAITLHMVKSRSVADPANIHWIRHYCKTYPNMRLILAHSARAFQPAHNLEGLSQLKGLDNLWFDSSANCEPIAHQSIFRIIGHRNFMYGSDLPVSHARGRSLSVADSFIWLDADSPVWGPKHQRLDPAYVGLEHLRSLKWACWSERLTDSQVEDVFYNNAARLFNLA